MESSEVNYLAKEGKFRDYFLYASVIETHISWVLISDVFVFKIKKPVKLPFLDFSTLELRKHFCIRELILNQAYSAIYLDVLPIRKLNGTLQIGGDLGVIIDYAVRMKRMEGESRMDIMLEHGKLSRNHIKALGNMLAQIHLNAEKIKTKFNINKQKKLFNAYSVNKPVVLKHMGEKKAKVIDKSIEWSNKFLKDHAIRLKQRLEEGFIRLLHGDLHCGNVFIADPPIIYDCIEFDDNLREIDLLSELGFISMDTEAHNGFELAEYLEKIYTKQTGAIQSKEDLEILRYYKCYRANIRFKTHLIGAMQQTNNSKFSQELAKAEKYLDLIENYIKPETYS